MKTFCYIILLTLLFALSTFSQEKIHTRVFSEKYSSKHLQNIYQLNLDFLGEFSTKDLRITVSKTLTDYGFLKKEYVYKLWINSQWKEGAKAFYTYDANNNLVELFTMSWYYFNWKNQSKSFYSYDAYNNLVEILSQSWNDTNWVNSGKSLYTYDGTNSLIEERSQYWNGVAWINSGMKYSYQYDENNNLVEELYQIWEDPAYVNFQKDLYTYDGGNNEISYLQLHWDGSTWVNNMKLFLYMYDEHNNLLENRWQYWNGSSWAGSGKNSYEYDLNNNLMQFISLDSGGGNAYKYLYQYDANNNKTEILYQNWEGSAWVNYDRYIYTFDGNNNLTEEIYQQWIASTWLNRFMYSYTYIPITEMVEYNNSVSSYSLSQNFPNPFNPSTSIKYSVPQPSSVVIKVFDVLGKEIETLVNEEKPAGKYEAKFNANTLASGVYIYQIKSGEFISSKKMILLK